MSKIRFGILLIVGVVLLVAIATVSACGGLFCQNIPVDQQAERIIFAVNADGTISAYVQINYTGSAPDFSWVVPVPNTPDVDVAEIATFDELSSLTAPIFMPPAMPECAPVPVMSMAAVPSSAAEGASDVTVLASGTAGPYAYDVVTSPDPRAMIDWLNQNNYRVTPDMEPLITVYNDEGMVFLAMKLQPDQGVQDIQPIVMTYQSTQPMIPLRLTAVAANPNMTVLTWIFADAQAVPTNWAHPVVEDEDLRGDFFSFGGTNYLQLVDATVDLYDGRAFITEYAMPTSDLRDLRPQDKGLQLLAEKYNFVTRVMGRISPEEMTVDPMFTFDTERDNISNIHDLTALNAETFWQCEGAPLPEVEYDERVVPEGFE